MLTKVQLREWRGHQNTEIPLSPFTLLVGPNGAGKTSVLDALHLIGQPFTRNIDSVFSGAYAPQWLRRQNADGRTEVVVSGKPDWTLGLRFEPSSHQGQPCAQITYGKDEARRSGDVIPAREVQHQQVGTRISLEHLWDRSKLPAAAVSSLEGALKLQLDSRRLAEPSIDDGSPARINADGSGLATVLMEMKLNQSDRFDELIESAQRVLPLLTDLTFSKAKKSRTTEDEHGKAIIETFPARELLLTFKDAKALPAHAVSEGTLLVLGFLAAIFSSDRPKLVLLDDVDRGLHPRAQQTFIRLLKRLREKLDIQIVATTHSPFLVDCFEANEVAVLLRDPSSGLITSSLLSEHPEVDLLDALSTGEFWMARGEKREEKPAPEATRVGD